MEAVILVLSCLGNGIIKLHVVLNATLVRMHYILGFFPGFYYAQDLAQVHNELNFKMYIPGPLRYARTSGPPEDHRLVFSNPRHDPYPWLSVAAIRGHNGGRRPGTNPRSPSTTTIIHYDLSSSAQASKRTMQLSLSLHRQRVNP
ncbi:hypothetical protein EI94DRAFT_1701299 [Lactarius quietus]|nr:hypothetical protein EI94DRAFT_1701299 [Lactarius quietus]